MVWRKARPATTVQGSVVIQHRDATVARQGRKQDQHLGPKTVDGLIARYIIAVEYQKPETIWRLKSVLRPWIDNKERFDFRLFDEDVSRSKGVSVEHYSSLDDYQDLILWQGWIDRGKHEVSLR